MVMAYVTAEYRHTRGDATAHNAWYLLGRQKDIVGEVAIFRTNQGNNDGEGRSRIRALCPSTSIRDTPLVAQKDETITDSWIFFLF